MPQITKIATCTYCGTRAALVLKGNTRHELACQACGAPLHDLKRLPEGRVDRHEPHGHGVAARARARRAARARSSHAQRATAGVPRTARAAPALRTRAATSRAAPSPAH